MATFDQLPADQRAIIELVLKRGRTYDALSDMLDMPATRVRELAREALTELAPYTAERVDPDWRAQIADYVLGQQSGPESAATQGHIKRSEPARAWLLSLMDSLDHLYANGSRPDLPEAEGERTRARDRKERGDRRDRDKSRGAAAVLDRKAGKDEDETAEEKEKGEPKKTTPLTGGRKSGPLSPAARSVVMRRRMIAGGVALVALLFAVLILTGVLFGGDDDDGNSSNNADRGSETTTNANQQPTQLVGQLQLDPLDKDSKDTIGVAAIAKTGNKMQLAVQAKLPPRTGEKEAYEVWLYNSKGDAVSIGAQRTDEQGNYQGAGDIPVDYTKYKYIDISAEKVDRNRAHSGDSIVRGEIANLVTPQEQQQQGGQGQQPGPAPAPGGGTQP
jgi:Anti-sigma-K factor rskA/Sigma-70, region 4